MTDRAAAYLAAAREALAHFPIKAGSFELFAVSENVTLLVREENSDEPYALRLHRPGYNSLAELVSERQWTQALATSGVAVQHSICCTHGEYFVRVSIPGGDERYAGLTRWLPGEPLADALEAQADGARVAEAFRAMGRLAARMHEQSRNWSPPKGFTRPRLDGPGLLGEAPRWGRFWEHPGLSAEAHRLLLHGREVLSARLQAYGQTPERFGLIHADLHPENLLLHDNGLSVIDFDDAAYGWYVYDLATALVEVWGTPAYDELRAALLAGYRECKDLDDDELSMLDSFILLRGMSLIGWFAQRPEHDDSDYFPQIRDRVLEACADLANP